MRKWMLLMLMLLAVPAAAVVITPEVVIIDQTADLQAAIDALPAATGGEIRLAATTYTLSAPLVIDRPVRITGMGQYSTFITMDNPDSNIVVITASSVSLRDLCVGVAGDDAEAGTGVGVKLIATTSIIADVILDKVRIQNTGSWGVKICGQTSLEAPDSSTYDIVTPVFSSVTIYNCQSGGSLYSGVGVSAPIFENCNFVGVGYTALGYDSWKWKRVIPACKSYATSSDTTDDSGVLPLGQVYLFSTTAALFRGCLFQLLGGDTPVLSFEDVIFPRVESCYFEVLSYSARTAALVTMSATSRFSFKDCYVRSPYDAPLSFLQTNTNPSSGCSGAIDGLYAMHGDSSGTHYDSDFEFNAGTADGDGAGGRQITLTNLEIYNIGISPNRIRDASIRQEVSSGVYATAFASQNVLLQNSSRRFRVPFMTQDSLTTMASLSLGTLVYGNAGTGMTGGLGKLLVVQDNASLAPIPTIPVVADTAAASALYGTTMPRREGDLCYTTGVHKLWVFTGTAWEAIH